MSEKKREIKGKWIVVDNVVYERLKDVGRKGETFNDIICRLLDSYVLRLQKDEETDSMTTPKE